jgi:hypothetical protein
LATIYPYGLNGNVKNLDNVSKKGTENIVVWPFFNKNPRKFTKHSIKRKRKHGTTRTDLEHKLKNLVINCNKPGLVHDIKTLVFGLLRRKLGILIDLANNLLLEQKIPKYIRLYKAEKSLKLIVQPKLF